MEEGIKFLFFASIVVGGIGAFWREASASLASAAVGLLAAAFFVSAIQG